MKEFISSNLFVQGLHIVITMVLFFLTILIINRLLAFIDKQRYQIGPTEEQAKGYSFLPDSFIKWIQLSEEETGLKVFPYIFKYIIMALVTITVIPGIAYYTHQNTAVYAIISLCAALFLVYTPFQTIKAMRKEREYKLTLEMVSYKESFALLMQQQNLYQSTIDSLRFAGPTIRPYIEKMIVELELYPGSKKPYFNLARELDQPDLETFFNSMLETVAVDHKKAKEVIAEELKQNDRIQESIVKDTIDVIGSKFHTSNTNLAMPILVIIMVFTFFTIGSMLEKSGLF